MVRVEFLRNTVANRQNYRVGDTPELPADEARRMILMGKAKPFVEQPAALTKAEAKAKAKAEAKAKADAEAAAKAQAGADAAAAADTQAEEQQQDGTEEHAEGDEPQDPFADTATTENKENQ